MRDEDDAATPPAEPNHPDRVHRREHPTSEPKPRHRLTEDGPIPAAPRDPLDNVLPLLTGLR